MKSNLKITFWLNLAKTNKNRLTPIYLRASDNDEYFTMTTGKYIIPSTWSKKNMHVKGDDEKVSAINEFLDAYKTRIQRIYSQLMLKNESFSVLDIKQMLNEDCKNQNKLLEYYIKYLKNMKSLEGHEFQKATIVKYTNTYLRLREFIQKNYKRPDVFLSDLDFNFMDEFVLFLKTKFKNNQTTCYKHYQRFSRVVRSALSKGLLEKYPFFDYKIKLHKKEIEFLTMDEIQRIDNLNLSIDRLRNIKNMYVFSCYSGLAYNELLKLKPSNIILGQDSRRWLYIQRQKTGKKFQVPLLPRAEEILDSYLNINSDKPIFPVPSNTKFNAYLKEIGTLAKIDKNLTTHLARKSFSVTIMLTNGVSIGVLSKCLGHSDIRITIDAYSKIVDKRIVEEISILREKLKDVEK